MEVWLVKVEYPYYSEEHGEDSIETEMEITFKSKPEVGQQTFYGPVNEVVKFVGMEGN